MRANAGQIGNRNLIYPGQKLLIPNNNSQITLEVRNNQVPNTSKPPVSSKPTKTTAPSIKNEPKIEQPKVNNQPTNVITNGNLKIAQLNLNDFLSPEKGSKAGFAVLIGNAEGN